MKIDFDYFDEREKWIIELTAQGFSAKEIGVKLSLSETRISNLRSRILKALKYKNSSQMSAEYHGYKIRKGQMSGGDIGIGEATYRDLVQTQGGESKVA